MGLAAHMGRARSRSRTEGYRRMGIHRSGVLSGRSLTVCRQVDILPYMAKKSDSNRSRSASRQIVGFSLSPEMAADIKVEAARRGLSLRQLLEEMWGQYKTKKPS